MRLSLKKAAHAVLSGGACNPRLRDANDEGVRKGRPPAVRVIRSRIVRWLAGG
jgi:hypothetical protein